MRPSLYKVDREKQLWKVVFWDMHMHTETQTYITYTHAQIIIIIGNNCKLSPRSFIKIFIKWSIQIMFSKLYEFLLFILSLIYVSIFMFMYVYMYMCVGNLKARWRHWISRSCGHLTKVLAIKFQSSAIAARSLFF